MTVMGDRTGFEWEQPPAYTTIDELTAAKWKRMKIRPSEPCTDAEFLRRVYLDLHGVIPTADQAAAGRTAYLANCAGCHLPDMSGRNEASPLAGANFMNTWRERTTPASAPTASGRSRRQIRSRRTSAS